MQLRSPPKALHNIKQYFVILCYSFIVGKIQNIESQGALQTDLNIKKITHKHNHLPVYRNL